MDIIVDRIISTTEATLSKVSIDGEFFCYGLEDEDRLSGGSTAAEQKSLKVAGETRIPAGAYTVGVRRVGGFHKRYRNSPHHKDYHRGMLQVQDVPNFEYILIHTGNTTDHTAGCLLVGESYHQSGENITIGQSRVAYEELYCAVIRAAEEDNLTITYKDNG